MKKKYMTQEEQKLLLQDLSARLPYGVKIEGKFNDLRAHKMEFTPLFYENLQYLKQNEYIKPYLRLMSSMTKEEKKEFCKIEGRLNFPCKHIKLIFSVDEFDWLNSHHFDYRGLIEKGLAIEAPEGMYK